MRLERNNDSKDGLSNCHHCGIWSPTLIRLLETINPNDRNRAGGANVNVVFLLTLGLRNDSGRDLSAACWLSLNTGCMGSCIWSENISQMGIIGLVNSSLLLEKMIASNKCRYEHSYQ